MFYQNSGAETKNCRLQCNKCYYLNIIIAYCLTVILIALVVNMRKIENCAEYSTASPPDLVKVEQQLGSYVNHSTTSTTSSAIVEKQSTSSERYVEHSTASSMPIALVEKQPTPRKTIFFLETSCSSNGSVEIHTSCYIDGFYRLNARYCMIMRLIKRAVAD